MVPELGHFALILALFLSISMAVLPLIGTYTGNTLWMASSRSLATGYFVFIAIAFGCLAYAFQHDDFSVRYVVSNSNTLLPAIYKFTAVWGGHEGSILLWVLILSAWTLAVSVFSRRLPLDMLARVLSVLGMVATGFLLFMLMTSNPFDRILPRSPQQGSDLNPLLQDPGMIIHPPVLYMGYVGFAVAFAFAIAALLSGRLDSAWARWSRPWTNVAWAFLSLGLALGSWWAYYELGWGGWWFWDPVENAAFMPWLVGTALIHSLAVTEKRGVFKSWTILLAIFAFSLSLLGTFLVRSGVITSVHAFANDPERGIFILLFLLVVIGGSLLLYALRVPAIKNVVAFSWFSRETLLLGNNILLMLVTATVLLGTLYPLIADALEWGKISVGPPYFNFFFAPLMGVLCLLLGVGIVSNWKRTRFEVLRQWLQVPLLISVAAGLVFPAIYGDKYSVAAAVSVFVGVWIVAATVNDIRRRLRNASEIGAGLKRLGPSYYGMVSAHIGVAFSLLGVCLNTIYSDQRDLRIEEGKQITAGGYSYQLVGVEKVRGPNYMADEGTVLVTRGGRDVASLKPQKRHYMSGGNIMTEAAIDAGFIRDIYVALGESLGGRSWAVRVHFKPFVRWIWLGALLMGFGAMLAVIDKRYRVKVKASAQEAGSPVPEAGVSINKPGMELKENA
ncbi:MAG: heme lyase CcmF/NrfE family subunit [Exilibacterium sp.]